MTIDIAQKLMPNLLTMAAQLGATFVIFLMYKKYLHEPVQEYLEKRSELIESEVKEAEALKLESRKLKEEQRHEYVVAMERLKKIEGDMMTDAEAKRKDIIASAQVEIDRRQAALQKEYELEKKKLYTEVQQYMLEVAVDVNRKVLQDATLNDTKMMDDLAKEMNAYDYKH